MNRLLVVTNAAAGSTDDERVDAALAVLREAADVRVDTCADAGDLDRLLDGLGDRTLVLAGGDGSVHTAVATLHRRGELSPDRPLALLPLGTGNDLARTLGIPLDPAEAARALLTGRPRPLDLLVDDTGGVVVNAVHMGIGAEAAEKAGALKERLGKAAYAVGSVLAGAGSTGWDLRVDVDGEPLHTDEPVLMVGVANGRTIGGGAELAPDAVPDDGLLDVVVATSTGPLARLGFGVALREGGHVEREDVVAVRGRTVTVTGEPFPLNADGELDGPVDRRTWTVRPGAWAVLVGADRGE
ncbi:MAG TPA: diacylglycerol kinase family protein [Actinomycetes bacterium]